LKNEPWTYLDRKGTALSRFKINQASVLDAGLSDTNGVSTSWPRADSALVLDSPGGAVAVCWILKWAKDAIIMPELPSETESSVTVSYSF
jgi:hypothetical protein